MLTYKEYLAELQMRLFPGTPSRAKARCIDKFESVLFGEFRRMGEKDTEHEKDIIRKVIRYVEGESAGPNNYFRSKDVVNAFKELMKCKEMYPAILKPDTTWLYRGTKISAQQWKQMDFRLGKPKVPFRTLAIARNPFKYTVRYEIQSWTSSCRVCYHFAHFGAMGAGKPKTNLREKEIDGIVQHAVNFSGAKNIPVLLEVKANQGDLLFHPEFMNKISQKLWSHSADEIIRIGKGSVQATLMIEPDIHEKLNQRRDEF